MKPLGSNPPAGGNGGVPGVTETFSLTEGADERYHGMLRFRWLMIFFTILFVIILGVLFAKLLLRGSPYDAFQSLVFAVLCIGFGGMSGLFSWGIWQTQLGPSSLRVSELGLEFTWPRGKVERIPWTKLRGAIILDGSEDPLLQSHTRWLWLLRRWNAPPAELSREAFDSIVGAARRAGLNLEDRPPSRTRYGNVRVLRFG
jgi:hypothetical protein